MCCFFIWPKFVGFFLIFHQMPEAYHPETYFFSWLYISRFCFRNIFIVDKEDVMPIDIPSSEMMKLIVSALICMNLCSCALIFQGSRQAVTINTTSDKARILVDGQQVGTGSCKVKLARKKDHTVIVKQDQCKTETVHIDSNVQPGWVIFDFFFNCI